MKNRLLAALTAVALLLQPSLSFAGSFAGKDATGATKNWKANGVGSTLDPYVPHHILTDGTNNASFETSGADAVSNTASHLAVSSWISGFNGTSWDRVRTGLTAASSSLLGYLNVIPVGQYNSSPITLTTGQAAPLQVTASGVLKVDNSGNTQPVSGTFWQATQPVSGTFWQATQPVSIASTVAVSAASLPLPSGAATAAKQPALGTAGTASADVLSIQGIAGMTAVKVDGSASTQPVSGTVSVSNFPGTQPVSGTVTANIGTSGSLALDATLTGGSQKTKLVDSAGTNVATISAGGALKVDNSAVTQPVSGTFWQATQPVSGTFWQATQPVSGTVTANIGTSGSLALDATLTGGSQKAIIRGGAKGSTSATDVTSTASGGNHQPLDVVIYDTSGNAITSFGGSGGTSSSFGSSFPSSGTAVGASDGTDMQPLLVESSSNKNLRVGLFAGANQATVSAGGALKVDNSAVTQPVSGTFWQATQPVSGTFWQATQPVSGTVTATLSSSTNAGATAKTSDYDSGAGTDTVTMFGVALPASGGAVQGGTSTNPLRVDPTGSTTQPVSGTITANAGTGTFTVSGTVTANAGTGTLSTNVAQLAGTTTDTNSGNKSAGTLRVVLATDQPQLTNKLLVTPDANSSVNLSQIAGNTTSTGNGTAGTGVQRVTIASDNTAFTVNSAQSGTWTVQPGNTANTTPWLISDQAATAGGATPTKVISAGSTNATSVKGSAGQVYMLTASNINASPRYLKLYNKASSPTVGTDTPVFTFLIPGNTSGTGSNIPIPACGIALGTGIALAITTGSADSDTGAVAAGDIIVNIGYK